MRPELQDIVDEAARVLRADTTLEDTDFNLVAYGTQRFDVDSVRRDSILQRRSSRAVREWFEQFGISASSGPLRTPVDADLGFHARICCPARWRGVTYGYLWALDDHTRLEDPAVARAAQLAEHAGAYLAQLSRQHRDDANAVSDLISADLDKARLAVTRIGDRGLIDPHRPVVAVVVGLLGTRHANDVAVPGLSPNLWSLPRAILADRGPTTTTLLVPLHKVTDDAPAREAAQLALRLYTEELPENPADQPVAGIGEPRADIGELRASWVEARQAARVAAAVPAVRPIARWADLGIYRLLAALPPSELAASVLDAPIRRLLNAPESDLVQTITVYLDHAGNVQDTAAALHIHRQTLYYRLNKAENLTGLSLSNGHDRSRLHIGLMLAPLLESS